jgi:hypothetical protein
MVAIATFPILICFMGFLQLFFSPEEKACALIAGEALIYVSPHNRQSSDRYGSRSVGMFVPIAPFFPAQRD